MPGLVDAGYINNEEGDDDGMPGLVPMEDVHTAARASAVPAPLTGGCGPPHSSGEESDDNMPSLESASSSDDEVEDDGVPTSEYVAGDIACASASPAPLSDGGKPGKG